MKFNCKIKKWNWSQPNALFAPTTLLTVYPSESEFASSGGDKIMMIAKDAARYLRAENSFGICCEMKSNCVIVCIINNMKKKFFLLFKNINDDEFWEAGENVLLASRVNRVVNDSVASRSEAFIHQ